MVNSVDTDKRELIARVATLELLVADLIDVLWRVDAAAMEDLSRAATHDLDIQHTHFMPAGAEHQRERLFAVLRNRQLKLDRGRAHLQSGAKAAAR
jgi:hypothetical protein